MMKLKNVILGIALVSLSSAALTSASGFDVVTGIVGNIADLVNNIIC